MNKLWGFTYYEIGPIDCDYKDRGKTWRDNITPFLEDMGGIVINPLEKPIKLISEAEKDIKKRKLYKINKVYDKLQEEMKLLRCFDLRCVDKADILICHLDLNIPTCGSFEEIAWANRCKKPILIHFEQGKENCYDWMFGEIPHQHIFSTWEDMKQYLINIDTGVETKHWKRFFFFEYDKMMPKRPPNTQGNGKKYKLEWVEDNV